MNKEQAIAALETERLNSSEAVIVVENGAQYFTAPTLYNAGLNKAIEILRSLPDETPTVLTREKLDELIAQTEPERCANCEYAGMREASAAMDGLRDYPTVQPLCDYHEGVGRLRDALLALGPVVVEGRPCANCSTSLVRCYDVSNPWATPRKVKCCPDCDHRPVVVDEPVECDHVDYAFIQSDDVAVGDGYEMIEFLYCPDCGTRLQGGENVAELG